MASLVAIMLTLNVASIHASTFLGAHPQVQMQSMPAQEVEQILLSELASFNTDARLSAAAAELQPLYAAMPKNLAGKLDPTVVRYALHRHFARKFGWHLRGLEPGGGAWNSSSPATIMKDKAPSYIMDIFERRLHGQGLGLEELAVFAVTLSDLILREAILDLEDIYLALGLSKSARLSDSALGSMIKMYLMMYITGEHASRKSEADFAAMEDDMENIIVWHDAKTWAQDVRLTLQYTELSRRNPFVSEYNFDDAVHAAQEMGRHFGNFQNMECKALKEKLVDMEHSGSGRVLLSKFYSGIDDRDWPFIESADYLRNLGALDDSDPKRPSVIIPNFLSSPSNCEAPSSFYSVCCIDECEGLLTQVEAAIAEPSAPVSHLVHVISNLPSDTVAAPRNLSSSQVTRLQEIAERHGGRVPLHGRLFMQWMHHAYPRECGFPHVAGSTNPLNQQDFADKFGLHTEVTDEELYSLYVDNSTLDEVPVTLPWTHAEELIAPHSHARGSEQKPSTSSYMRVLALVAAILSAGFPMLHAKKHLNLVDDKQERFLV